MTTAPRRPIVALAGLLFALAVSNAARAQAPAEPSLGPAPRVTDPEVLAESLAGPAHAALSPIDPSDRQAVVALYNTTYVPAMAVAAGWTGSTATCTAGNTSAAYAEATMAMVNYFRAMTRLPAALPHNATKDGKAQAASLMMSANSALSHSPPTLWKCYTTAGAEAAGKSNLALGAGGAYAITLYMRDAGSSNTALGHRRWVLYPRQVEMGTGSTNNANALWVIGNFGSRPAAPEIVAWPPTGHVPYQVVYPRWSFSVNTGSTVDLSAATVAMTAGTTPVTVTLLPLANGYGDNTLAWEPSTIAKAAGMADLPVTVQVRNVKVDGVPRDFTYTVTIIDPVMTPCSYSVSPSPASIGADGGTGTVTVTASASSCPWTASVGAGSPWLRVVGGSSGTGSGTVTFAAEPNAGGARSGTLLVAGQGVTLVQAATPTAQVFRRYLAEGAVSGTFDTRLALLNPDDVPTVAVVTYLPAGGAPVSVSVPVPARTRATVDPRAAFGDQAAEFSTTVESDRALVADRTMTWAEGAAFGAHAETALPAPAPRWYLAEGATHGGFNLFYLLQNPNPAPVSVRVRYLRPVGAVLEKTYTLPPASRTSLWVDYEEFPSGSGQRALADTDVSAVIEALDGASIIVERAMYADVPGQFFGAGHEGAGVTAPATEWFLAEGATGPYFDLFVLVANPGDEPAEVEASFLLPDGSAVVRSYAIAPATRFNIWVDHADPRLADTAVSTTVRSRNGVPIIVERAMWWPGGPGTWHEAHSSAGATTTGVRWALAEGEVNLARNLETYILIANTSEATARVRVTLLFEDGTIAVREFGAAGEIPGRSRFNVPVGASFPEAAGRRFGAIVESLGDVPAQLVVERAMYWDAAGQRWAAGTNALATPLP